MMFALHHEQRLRGRRAFSLTEMLVAVLILVVILLATSKIFGSASDVASQGQANADILQELNAFERQLRQDFQVIAPEGFMAIVSRRVRNDINGTAPEVLLDPERPFNDYIRSDQIVFFTNATQSVQTFRAGEGVNKKPQSAVSRVYYGHGFQLENAEALEDIVDFPLFFPPWYSGGIDVDGGQAGPRAIDGTQPPAPAWTLARQAILMADDDQIETYGDPANEVYLFQANSVDLLSDKAIRDGRVDLVAQQMNDLRQTVTGFGSNNWQIQRAIMQDQMMFYPRAEREVNSMFRQDHATTISTLGSACSEFIIEWTYDHNTWFNNGVDESGFIEIFPDRERPWFGMPDENFPLTNPRGTDLFADWTSFDSPASEIEVYDNTDPVHVYSAIFGFDKNFTPWPSAIRITMRIHDVNGAIEQGRQVQFVINLPKRLKNERTN